MKEMIQSNRFELMLKSHEPIEYPYLTPGVAVFSKVAK